MPRSQGERLRALEEMQQIPLKASVHACSCGLGVTNPVGLWEIIALEEMEQKPLKVGWGHWGVETWVAAGEWPVGL